MAYFVYWIVSGRLSYIGATVAPHRRLRQHNGELAGGARRTRSRTDWRFKCIVSGFRTWQEALQFEWAFKYHSRRCRGVESRALALTALMERERWTANAPLASGGFRNMGGKFEHFGHELMQTKADHAVLGCCGG